MAGQNQQINLGATQPVGPPSALPIQSYPFHGQHYMPSQVGMPSNTPFPWLYNAPMPMCKYLCIFDFFICGICLTYCLSWEFSYISTRSCSICSTSVWSPSWLCWHGSNSVSAYDGLASPAYYTEPTSQSIYTSVSIQLRSRSSPAFPAGTFTTARYVSILRMELILFLLNTKCL